MIEIQHRNYALSELHDIIHGDQPIALSEELKERIENGRAFLNTYLKKAERPIYGINTGFGSLYNVQIESDDLGRLQENLVKSHACGVGSVVPVPIVRYMLLLKILGLSKGNSGVNMGTVERLVDFLNNDIIPVVYEQGSLGASGDLAPLAHLSLPLLGLGEVWFEGKRVEASEALSKCELEPIALGAKEGLALLNGTQFMSAYGVFILNNLVPLLDRGDMIAALALDAFDGRIDPFHPGIHALRPHPGQQLVANNMRELLEESSWIGQEKEHVQDPYSFRCIPQVHGASRDTIDHVMQVFEREVNSVTDNPTLIPEDDLIVSAGNFHGQPLALAFDHLAIAVAELASISERRTYKLMSGQRGLPTYLVANPGLNSGFMIAQYTAASVVSQNKQLCTPASVDTIDSSNGQEDHVSMGANAATRTYRVYQNYIKVMAIELLSAAQAADFREGQSSPQLEQLRSAFRAHVAFVEDDVILSELIHQSIDFIQHG